MLSIATEDKTSSYQVQKLKAIFVTKSVIFGFSLRNPNAFKCRGTSHLKCTSRQYGIVQLRQNGSRHGNDETSDF